MATSQLDAARVAVFSRQKLAVRDRVQAFASRVFAAGQYRDADVARFVSRVVPVVLAGRRQVSSMTDAYLTQQLKAAGIKAPMRGPINTAALRGVSVDEVYARPYQSVWTSLSNNAPYPDAVAAGHSRLMDLISTDMQLAMTHTSQDVLTHTRGVSEYVRSPSGPNPCALCEIASTQVYHRADLMPIHANCMCGVDVVSESSPWNQAVADQRLSDAYARQDQPEIAVREHGEIGPVLTRADQHFTGPGDLAA